MSLAFNDWSTHLMRAEVQLKAMEHKLLHKDYEDLARHAQAIHDSVDGAMSWYASQGRNGGANVLEALDFFIANAGTGSRYHAILLAAKTEIEHLMSERQFWLKAGFDIGKIDAVKK